MIHAMSLTAMKTEYQVRAATYERDCYGSLKRPYVMLTPPHVANTWKALKEKLESTEDYFLWTYNKHQKEDFFALIKEYGLEKYIVHQSVLVTNPNYKERRVATLIMKGIPNEQAVQVDAGV